jgi:hypothetical protein
VTLLNEIRDLLKQNNNVDRTVSLNEDLEIPAFMKRD